MINFKVNDTRFNFRIAGITIYNNRVLLHRMLKDNFWALPGGRCELLEYSNDALIREYKEEIDIDVKMERVLFFVENFFHIDQEPYLDLDEFTGVEEDVDLIFKWFNVTELCGIELYPTFLKEEIGSLPKVMKHIMHRDN